MFKTSCIFILIFFSLNVFSDSNEDSHIIDACNQKSNRNLFQGGWLLNQAVDNSVFYLAGYFETKPKVTLCIVKKIDHAFVFLQEKKFSLGPKQKLLTTLCSLDGVPDISVFVIAANVDEDRENLADVKHAFKFDLATERIMELDVSRVRCQ